MVWQRARSDEQKEQRRRALLEAAARLHEAQPLDAISLSAIAREANVSKANVYRYFESREDLFLDLMLESSGGWARTLRTRLAELEGRADGDAVAQALVSSVLEHPRFARLAAVLTTVLEANVGVERVVRFKTELMGLVAELVPPVQAVFPGWEAEHASELLQAAWMMTVALWPAAHPAPAVREALKRPELAHACVTFEPTMKAMLKTQIRGIEAARGERTHTAFVKT
ncbi:MAG: TetR family transcriptional regulator [Myxococcota bacterium]